VSASDHGFRLLLVRGSPDDHEDPRTGGQQGLSLETVVAEVLVGCQDDPTPRGDLREPDGVGDVLGEVIVVDLDLKTGLPQALRDEMAPQVAVGEEDPLRRL